MNPKNPSAGNLQGRRVLLLLPPLALMGLIFYLSDQPDLNSGLGTWDTILRKLAHMLEFGLLAVLWNGALSGDLRRWRPLTLGAAATIGLAYAVTDELHQRSVTDRVGSPVDVAIDAVGIAIAVVVMTRLGRPPK